MTGSVNAGPRLDRLPLSAFHRRVVTLIAIGMFFDGYDVYVAATVLGANLLSEALKLVFQRPRPESFFGFESPITYSFPSGHAMVSLVFYLALAEVLAPPGRRPAARVAAAVLSLAVGFSRVYLGVHYPTDVAAGWAGAAVCLGAAQFFRRRIQS